MGFWKPAGRQAYPGCRFRSACSSCWEAYFSALSQPISTKLALSNLQEYRKSPTEPFFSNFVVKIRIFFQLTHHFQQQPHRHHSCGRYMRYRLGIPVYLGHFCIDLYETRNEYSTGIPQHWNSRFFFEFCLRSVQNLPRKTNFKLVDGNAAATSVAPTP